jgi:hypothetical protein
MRTSEHMSVVLVDLVSGRRKDRAKAFAVAPSAGHRPFSASRMIRGCAIAQTTYPGFPTPSGRFIGKRST